MIAFYSKIKTAWWGTLRALHPKLHSLAFHYRMYIKYILSGGTAAVTDLALLVAFKEFGKLHYLLAATLAFAIAFFVSFVLQKFWTFGHTRLQDLHTQMGMYLSIALFNLGLNALFMYLLVDIVGFWYLVSQIISGASIALISFGLYRRFVFTHTSSL